MKNLTLILSFVFVSLAISLCSFAEEWLSDKDSGCQVWGDHAKYKSYRWEGECTNGKANGRGIFHEYVDGKEFTRREGEYRDGKMNGKGTYINLKRNFRYDGEWKDDKFHGKGTTTDANGGGYFVGEFRDGQTDGYGKWTFVKGDSKLKYHESNGKWVGETYVIEGLWEKGEFLFSCPNSAACLKKRNSTAYVKEKKAEDQRKAKEDERRAKEKAKEDERRAKQEIEDRARVCDRLYIGKVVHVKLGICLGVCVYTTPEALITGISKTDGVATAQITERSHSDFGRSYERPCSDF